jgi:hypothetical protein
MANDVNITTTSIVEAIQTVPVSSTAPTTNQVLEYDGTEWTPTNLPSSLPPSGAAGGDLGGTYPNPIVVNIQTKALSSSLSSIGASQDGYVLTWVNGSSDWEAKATGVGSIVLAGDVTGPYNANVVSAISGNSPIVITPAQLQFATTTVSPTLKQTDLATNSGTGATLTIQAQNETGTTSIGGTLVLTSGSGTTAPGDVLLQMGGTTLLDFSGGTIGNITFTNTAASPNFSQTALASTSIANGIAGKFFIINAQNGQTATGAHTGGTGGGLNMSAGNGGTASGSTAGAGGALQFNGGIGVVDISAALAVRYQYRLGAQDLRRPDQWVLWAVLQPLREALVAHVWVVRQPVREEAFLFRAALVAKELAVVMAVREEMQQYRAAQEDSSVVVLVDQQAI